MQYYYETSQLSCWLVSAVWVALAGAFALKDRANGGRGRVLFVVYCACRAIGPLLYAVIPTLSREYDRTALAIVSILFFSVPASVIFTIATVVVATTLDGIGGTESLKSYRRWICAATSLALAFILSSDFLAIIYAPIPENLIMRFCYGAAVIGYSVLFSMIATLQLVLTNGANPSVEIEEGGLQSVLAPSWRTYLPMYFIVIAKIIGPMLQLILMRGWQSIDSPLVALSVVMGSLELLGMIGLVLRRVPNQHSDWAERLLFGRADAGVRLV
ncbi:hypothetical protein HDU87_007312 [Geranomyces variabilis]|uniref:Uncharacterized protein n=1 Tax=Geranomyces variabilis TaxID=109894 RepID=A0AAD5XNB8_9FUNG|nr:hypothetical protein HDU87_007312 [Geranomyces variabilis]